MSACQLRASRKKPWSRNQNLPSADRHTEKRAERNEGCERATRKCTTRYEDPVTGEVTMTSEVVAARHADHRTEIHRSNAS